MTKPDDGKEPVTEVLKGMYAKMDEIIVEVSKQANATCKKGCAFCCELLTLITLPEALLIAEHMLTDTDWRATLPKLAKAAKDNSFVGLTRVSYGERRIRCAFLGEDNLCTIYEQRPVCCRAHVVISDPSLCELKPENKNVQTSAINFLEFEGRVWEFARDVEKELGFRSRMGFMTAPIPIMVLAALYEISKDEPEVHAEIKVACRGVPNPAQWLDKYGFVLAMEPSGIEQKVVDQITQISKRIVR